MYEKIYKDHDEKLFRLVGQFGRTKPKRWYFSAITHIQI